jgi:hypothetical protein
MKSRSGNHVCATVFAALTIIGFSLSLLRFSEKRRAEQRKVLDEAVRTWEDEGGAFVAEADDDEVPARG